MDSAVSFDPVSIDYMQRAGIFRPNHRAIPSEQGGVYWEIVPYTIYIHDHVIAVAKDTATLFGEDRYMFYTAPSNWFAA